MSGSARMIAAGAVPSRIASAMAPGAEPEPRVSVISSMVPVTQAPRCGWCTSRITPVRGSKAPQKLKGSSSDEHGPFRRTRGEDARPDHALVHNCGSRQTSPRMALSTHSFSEPKATSTPSMPGA